MPVAPGVGEASTGRPRPRRPPAAPSTLPGSGHHGHHPAAGQRARASGLLPGQGAGRVLLGPEPRGREELQPCLGWGEEEGGTHGPMAPLSLCHEPEEQRPVEGPGADRRQWRHASGRNVSPPARGRAGAPCCQDQWKDKGPLNPA